MEIHVLKPRYKIAQYTLENTQPLNKIKIPYKFIPLTVAINYMNTLVSVNSFPLQTPSQLNYFIQEKFNDTLPLGLKFEIIKTSNLILSTTNFEPHIKDDVLLENIKFNTDVFCSVYSIDKNLNYITLTVLIDTESEVQV